MDAQQAGHQCDGSGKTDQVGHGVGSSSTATATLAGAIIAAIIATSQVMG
jgi:hypothetical protein